MPHSSKHAADFGWSSKWNKTTAMYWEQFIRSNLLNYTKTFQNTLGGTSVIGYYRKCQDMHVATYVYVEGKDAGKLATIVKLTDNQMSKFGLW